MAVSGNVVSKWKMAAVVVACTVGTCDSQTLPLPSGEGFVWERVGDFAPQGVYNDITFDAEATVWLAADGLVPGWLEHVGGGTEVWHFAPPRVSGPQPYGEGILTLGGHPAGGPARADTVLYTLGLTGRSTDGGVTWSPAYPGFPIGNHVLIEVPPGYPHAGRILVGASSNGMGYSDDRGASWIYSTNVPPADDFGVSELLVLPPPDLLPGAASGRTIGAPSEWPSGRVIAGGDGGLGYSDDGAASYRASNWFGQARLGERLALVRRPDTHPLGPGPRLIMTGVSGGDPAVAAWTSDDGGTTWTKRAFLYEPITAPGYGRTLGIFPLAAPGETDPGATGEAIAVLGLGHIFRTTDAGETWHVVGRAPAMSDPDAQRFTNVGAAEMGPDGRLYIAVSRPGPAPWEWVYRTTEPFVVADEATAPLEAPEGVVVSVRPNPTGGRVAIVLSVAKAGTARVVVVDALGREVAVVLDGAVSAGETVAALETGSWPVGVYVVRASVGVQTATARLVVAR